MKVSAINQNTNQLQNKENSKSPVKTGAKIGFCFNLVKDVLCFSTAAVVAKKQGLKMGEVFQSTIDQYCNGNKKMYAAAAALDFVIFTAIGAGIGAIVKAVKNKKPKEQV